MPQRRTAWAAGYSPETRAERLIGAGRVVLAVSSLFAVWLDPTEPARHRDVAYTLLGVYTVYAVLVAIPVWRLDTLLPRHRLLSHAFDLTFFSLFILFTAGPASPFTAYFVFSLVCATLRWGWRETLWTAAVALSAFLGISLYVELGEADPDLHQLIIRGVYFAVVAILLAYAGAYEHRTRREISLLAAWPQHLPDDLESEAEVLLRNATELLEAPRALLWWADEEEPWLHMAVWQRGEHSLSRSPAEGFRDPVLGPLRDASFLCSNATSDSSSVVYREARALRRWTGRPLDAELVVSHEIESVLALRLPAETLTGRLMLLDKSSLTSDDLLLGEIVASVVGARLDHFNLSQRLQQSAATEERIRLARDLHDGVLQSLTGIGLRLAAAVRVLEEGETGGRSRLAELQRHIASVQHDLRFFIQELKPAPMGFSGSEELPARLREMVERMETEWDLEVHLDTDDLAVDTPVRLTRDIYHLVREGIVNAVRHGGASEVHVRIAGRPRDAVSVVVADNGCGFPFQGRFAARELARDNLGPKTLRERVVAGGGSLTIESTPTGARLEIGLPLATES